MDNLTPVLGFSQSAAMGLGLSTTDLVILRWFIDKGNAGVLFPVRHEGQLFFWIDYEQLITDMPILDLKKDTLFRRMRALAAKGVLTRHFTNCIDPMVTPRGSYSCYGIGPLLKSLVARTATREEG